MPLLLFSRLSFMMFMQYFVPGCILPILALYLKDFLHFEPYQIGIVLAMPAAGGFLAPYLVANIADRYLSAERLLALAQLAGGVIMLGLARQTSFVPFMALYFLFGVILIPSFGLTNTICMHHVPNSRRYFGIIRGIGTAGWVAVAWLFGYFWVKGGTGGASRLPDALVWCALASFASGLYALTLPRSNVQADRSGGFTYWKAIRVFAKPSLMILCGLTLLNCIVHQSYYYAASHYMRHAGFADEHLMPSMSIGQVCEVITLISLAAILAKLGMRRTLILGALAQFVRAAIFAFAPTQTMILVGLSLHGLCYGCFFTAAYIYVDEHSTRDTRAGAQQLYTLMISGVGNLIGFLVAGAMGQWVADPVTGAFDYRSFWMMPAALALVVTVGLLFFFREEQPDI